MSLDLQPTHRRMGQRAVDFCPVSAVVERHVQRILGAGVQHALAHRIFAHHVHVAEHTLRNIVTDTRPGLAEVCCLVDVRIAIIDEVRVDRNVRRAGVVLAGLNT